MNRYKRPSFLNAGGRKQSRSRLRKKKLDAMNRFLATGRDRYPLLWGAVTVMVRSIEMRSGLLPAMYGATA